MFKATITNIEKVRHQATNSDFLDVVIEITDVDAEGESTVVSVQRHAFAPAISKEELQSEVRKVLKGFEADRKQAEIQAEHDKADANVQDLKDALVGHEVGEVETDEN